LVLSRPHAFAAPWLTDLPSPPQSPIGPKGDRMGEEMAVRMPALRRTKSGSWSSRKAIPRDVQDAYRARYSVRHEAKFHASASCPRPTARKRHLEWQAEVHGRIAAIRAEQRGEGHDLTRREARALVGSATGPPCVPRPLGSLGHPTGQDWAPSEPSTPWHPWAVHPPHYAPHLPEGPQGEGAAVPWSGTSLLLCTNLRLPTLAGARVLEAPSKPTRRKSECGSHAARTG
jgi:hypothetical protein